MSELNVGVVGLGWVTGAHIETFKQVKGAKVTAVYSRRPQDSRKLEAQFGIPIKVYSDYADMLADPDIDVIDICTEHPLHAEQAVAAAKAGKHLIIEKPICLSWDDLKRIRKAVRAADVQTCVCFECRFSDHMTMVRSTLDQGLLGQLHYGEIDYYHGLGPWYRQTVWNVHKQQGGSSLLTAGCHALDLMLWFMAAPVAEVTTYATGSKADAFSAYEYPTTSVTILKFADGRVGKVTSCVDCLQPYYFHLHLVGSEGSLLDNRIYSRKIKGIPKERWSTLATTLIDSGDVKNHPYQAQFQAYADALHGGKPMPLTSLDDAFETHRVTFAADRSASEGRPVKMSEFRA